MKNYYKLIGIDLSRQANTNIPQQINFTRELEKDDGGTMFFIPEKHKKKRILNFSLLTVTEKYNNRTSKNIKFIE